MINVVRKFEPDPRRMKSIEEIESNERNLENLLNSIVERKVCSLVTKPF